MGDPELPDAVVIAGANGAGKTTFAGQLLPLVHPACVFLNADEIQREDTAFSSPAAAGRELLRRLANRSGAAESFALETTLSSLSYARKISAWKTRGFTVWLYFLDLSSPDLAIVRVAQRVAAGGHGVPEVDIRRRFGRGKKLFPAYQSLADAWYHFHIDEKGSTLVAFKDP